MKDSVTSNDEDTNDKITTDSENSLASDVDPSLNKIMKIEGVDRVYNEIEERNIEVVESETELVDSYNEVVDK